MKDINLYPEFLSTVYSKTVYDKLLATINWQDELLIIGTSEKKKIRRKMSYVSEPPVIYQYTNLQLQGESWTNELIEIKHMLEARIGIKFNSCLLNLYKDGKDEIRWHSDKEEQLGENPIIACVNLGATRNFWFLEKETKIQTPWRVSNGDLLIMGENCQKNYLHAILKEKNVTEPRISLTYRLVK